MAENETPKPAPPAVRREYDAGHVPITEEFDSPRRTLPPILPLAIALVVVVVFIVGVGYIFRSKPVAEGKIDTVFVSQKSGQAKKDENGNLTVTLDCSVE